MASTWTYGELINGDEERKKKVSYRVTSDGRRHPDWGPPQGEGTQKDISKNKIKTKWLSQGKNRKKPYERRKRGVKLISARGTPILRQGEGGKGKMSVRKMHNLTWGEDERKKINDIWNAYLFNKKEMRHPSRVRVISRVGREGRMHHNKGPVTPVQREKG